MSETAFILLVELGDRMLDLAFREGRQADRAVIEQGRDALCAYLERLSEGST